MRRGALFCIFCLVIPTHVPWAQADPAERFRDGNRAYAAGRYDAARQAYQDAAAESTATAAVFYNLGAALYRQRQYTEAAASFETASAMAETGILRSRSWYNLGNSMVKAAETTREADPHSALALCREAMWAYRYALHVDPAFPDAAHNLEVSQHLAADILAKIREEEEKEAQDSHSSKGESDENSDSEDAYDMEYEPSDQDADTYEEADPFGDFSEYEEIRGVPPPNQSEADILAEELRNQEQRKQKRAAEYQAVERDW